jgi:hypothetical protein
MKSKLAVVQLANIAQPRALLNAFTPAFAKLGQSCGGGNPKITATVTTPIARLMRSSQRRPKLNIDETPKKTPIKTAFQNPPSKMSNDTKTTKPLQIYLNSSRSCCVIDRPLIAPSEPTHKAERARGLAAVGVRQTPPLG